MQKATVHRISFVVLAVIGRFVAKVFEHRMQSMSKVRGYAWPALGRVKGSPNLTDSALSVYCQFIFS
jgi:hypothetical protein